MKDTVLVVEDEEDVVDLIRYNLNKAGFSVLVAMDGRTGLTLAREYRPDVMVLDLMLPGLDGRSLCKILKNDPMTESLPILMLTARGGPDERIEGLEIGADDYMGKPFSPKELVLRLQALLRRVRTKPQADNREIAPFQVCKSTFEIRLEGRRLELTATEFKLLSLMMERRGRVLSRDTLLQDVWGYQHAIDTRTVDTHMRRLREKLGTHASRLETIRGEGYRFNSCPAS